MTEKETGKSRGFGFITYDSWQSVEEVLKKNDHTLRDKVVEVIFIFQSITEFKIGVLDVFM